MIYRRISGNLRVQSGEGAPDFDLVSERGQVNFVIVKHGLLNPLPP
jgi:hypothetical protein